MKPLHELDDDALADALTQSRLLHDAPEAVIDRAIAVFQSQPQARGAQPAEGVLAGVLRRVLAVVSFDSAGESLLAHGVRSGAMSSRQVIYSAEGRDIELRIVAATDGSAATAGAAAGAGWVLFGQVLGPDREGQVELDCGDRRLQTMLDDMSEFRFDGVPGGVAKVSLRLADTVIELPPLEVPRPTSGTTA